MLFSLLFLLSLTAGVAIAACPVHPEATSICDKTFSGRCYAASFSNMAYSCPTGSQLFIAGSKAPVSTCDGCTVSCVNDVWTMSQGATKLPTGNFVGDNPMFACIKPAPTPPCGALADAMTTCKRYFNLIQDGQECYPATYSALTYSCPGGTIFFTGPNLEEFATCSDPLCAFTCSKGVWTEGSENDWGKKAAVACLSDPPRITQNCAALRDATVNCNRIFPGRCSPATYSNKAYSCANGKLFVSGSRSMVANVDALKCLGNSVWTVTQGGAEVSSVDFVGTRPIVCCIN